MISLRISTPSDGKQQDKDAKDDIKSLINVSKDAKKGILMIENNRNGLKNRETAPIPAELLCTVNNKTC